MHTHSILSHDGGIREEEYQHILKKGMLDYVAITDHNTIAYAIFLRKSLGEQIIVGEEITSKEGHVIGLFLTKPVAPFLPLQETISLIKNQGGIVYIPHPFDVYRKGIGEKHLILAKKDIDVIETFNARVIFRSQNQKATQFAEKLGIVKAAGSDAHAANGLGKTYTSVMNKITRDTLKQTLQNALLHEQYASFFDYLSPKVNRVKKRLRY